MLATTKHLRRTNVVTRCPEAKCQFPTILRDVERANQTTTDQVDAIVGITLLKK
jgi:hypothetical protein